LLSPKSKKPARRWWQWAVRLAATALLVGAGVYATLPYWMPTGFIRDHLADQMSRQMGVDVAIRDMSFSWSEGIELSQLEISCPTMPETAPMVQVQSIRAEFSPIGFFFHKRIAWMELERPTVLAEVDDKGQLNLAVLEKLRFDAVAHQISVRQAEATIKLHGHEQLLRLRVHSAEYVAGRLRELGRVTLSATLDQKDSPAPLSMRMVAGTGETVPAKALLNFADIDLSQLPLTNLLGLPLAELGGKCRGSLELQLNRYGVVDQFALDVSVAELDVQPSRGTSLPTIPQAVFRISAVFDPIGGDLESGLLEIQSAQLRIPGLDVSGSASVSTDILTGRWEAISSLDVRGNISPDALAMLLLGHPDLPGPLQVSGPVSFRASAQRNRTIMRGDLSFDARPAQVSWAGELVKPPGRALQMAICGSLDWRTWKLSLDADSSSLYVGKNRFAGGGTIADVRRLMLPVTEDSLPGRVSALPERLSLLDWSTTFSVCELESLGFLTDALVRSIGPIDLQGELAGQISVKQQGDTDVSISLSSEPGTVFSVGDLFSTKLASAHDSQANPVPMSLRLSATACRRDPILRSLKLDCQIGQGQLSIDKGTLQLAPGSDDTQTLVACGAFEATGLGALIHSAPALSLGHHLGLGGNISGQYELEMGEDRRHAFLRMDCGQTAIDLPGILQKPAGLESAVAIELDGSTRGTDFWPLEASAKATIPGVDLVFATATTGASLLTDASNWELRIVLTDAGKLVSYSPKIRELFSGGHLAGKAELAAVGTRKGDRLSGTVEMDASYLDFSTGGTCPRVKTASVPMGIGLEASVLIDQLRRVLHVQEARLQLGQSRIRVSGNASIRRARGTSEKASPSPLGDDGLKFTVEGRVCLDEALGSVFPEVDRLCERHSITGSLNGRSDLVLRLGQLAVNGSFDATKLNALRLSPIPSLAKWRDQEERRYLAKPSGMPTKLDFELTAPEDLSWVRLNNLLLEIGDATVLADGFAKLHPRGGSPDQPESNREAVAHLAASIPDANILKDIVPWFASYDVGGSAYAEVAMSASEAQSWEVECATVKASALSASSPNMNILIDGDITGEGFDIRPGGEFSLKRFETPGLWVRFGRSRFWLDADIQDLDKAPSGNARLVAHYLDIAEMSKWLAGGSEEATASRDDGSAERAFRLSEEERDMLADRASNLVRGLRQHLANAEIKAQLTADHLRTWDPSVEQHYDLSKMRLSLDISQGNISCGYVAGLNGGTIRNSYTVKIDDPEPVVIYHPQMRNVIATESIQPQLARYFPGNTVNGLFTRSERSKAPLKNIIANAMDYRFPLQNSGEAKTITTDGLVEGRAAPRFVTRFFPGLNLTKYRYKKMTAFASFRPDGVAKNDMVFSGPLYDIYIDGETDADNVGRYQIGLILLGSPQSPEWNHTYRQGRIPILKLKARIEGGRMHDEEVSYPWPSESLFVVLLQNNIFYQIWLAAADK